MVNYSSYGYDEAYRDFVYRDPEYLAVDDINFFGKVTGKVMEKDYVINLFYLYWHFK